jgi:hypothetical protein
MSRAREFADLASSVDAGGITGRNLIINGAMQVAQRGTSETGVTTEKYANAPDRFKFIIGNAGTWTVSQSTTAPEGFSNSYKLDCTTADASLAAGDYIIVSQFIEGQNLQHLKKGTSNAEPLTLSFWVRSAKTGTYIVEIRDNDNTRSISQSYTVSSANTWERKTLTFSGDTTGTLGNDNGNSLAVQFWLAAGSTFSSGTLATSWGSVTNANRAVGQVNIADSTSNDWYITGVQLEVGEQATPFEHRSYGDELFLCQRYYQRTGNFTGFFNNTTGRIRGILIGAREMRASPTASNTTGIAVYYQNTVSVGSTTINTAPNYFNISSASFIDFTSAVSTSVQGQGCAGDNNPSVRYFELDAEL